MRFMKLIQLVALSALLSFGCAVNAQSSELVLRCNVTMNKTIFEKKEKQRVEEVTLVIKEFTLGGVNLIRVTSPDSTWVIFLSANAQDAVEPYGWKLNQTSNSPNNQIEISFYLNRYNGEFTHSSNSKDVQFFVKGSCKKPEAKF